MLKNYPFLTPIASKYLDNSSRTFGKRKQSPIMFGTDIAKIIASEKSVTAPRLADEPIMTNKQNKIL